MDLNRIALIGDHLPRQCGIATFTTDLAAGLASEFSSSDVFVVPVNDREEGYAYPPMVRFEFSEGDLGSYRRAAEFLNINSVDAVSVQHEYGIYGGPAGSHVLSLLKQLRTPVVTTLHTVLKDPTENQRRVLEELADVSDRLVVMAERGIEYLTEIYKVPREKIDFIHHGIPDVPFVDPNFHKDLFGVEGKTLILTFGLLSPNKGIEYVIEALPAIIEKHPEVVYLIQGATHPAVKRDKGEMYRLSLQRLAKLKKVESHVIFHNRFVSLEELVQYISAADIYVLPYLNLAQLVSGTLAYSVGAGKAVVSTPIWYAEEILAEGRGEIVPEKNSEAIAEKVIELLDNEAQRHAMRKRAYQLGRDMIWSKVAQEYAKSFERARENRSHHPRSAFVATTLDKLPRELPLLRLDHLHRMTDDTGLLQHAKFSVPDYDHGYCTDDNARALILMVLLEGRDVDRRHGWPDLATRYLAFLHNAFNKKKKRFRNFLSYERKWLEDVGSDDSQGRALWALGTVAGRSKREGLHRLASDLFEQALPEAKKLKGPRSCAFALMGIHEYLRRFYGHRIAQQTRISMAERLLALYEKENRPDWPWFENKVTYANAKLPHALFLSGRWLDRSNMVDTALTSLDWLCKVQTREEGSHFVPIGSNGFYERGKEAARFDQQPIEAYSTVSACLEAHRVTGDEKWMEEAQRAFEWFLGGNDLGIPIYNPETGGCSDGLEPDSVNDNQGAESTLSFLLARVEMEMAEHVIQDPNGK